MDFNSGATFSIRPFLPSPQAGQVLLAPFFRLPRARRDFAGAYGRYLRPAGENIGAESTGTKVHSTGAHRRYSTHRQASNVPESIRLLYVQYIHTYCTTI